MQILSSHPLPPPLGIATLIRYLLLCIIFVPPLMNLCENVFLVYIRIFKDNKGFHKYYCCCDLSCVFTGH